MGVIKKYKLPTKMPSNCEPQKILKAMELDKKNKNNSFRFIILNGLGKVEIIENVPEEKILNSLKI